ncbi:MAG: class I SAM-dependent methyltransferase [Gammaproteobacteria bacterium]|nr:class I SAM-dependent methyltransferase [Gammaproteobacteria bacterium]
MTEENHGFTYGSADPSWDNAYLWNPVEKILAELDLGQRRLFELGCGNGVSANTLAGQGYSVTAVDTSESGIAIATKCFPSVKFALGSAYDDLCATYGSFPVVLSLEVVEHLFWPRRYANTVFNLLEPGGTAIISTPYHGYLKNLAIAVSGKFDSHVDPLADGGHIKFWSEHTLGTLLSEAGFKSVKFVRAGRIPQLAKSMIAVAVK